MDSTIFGRAFGCRPISSAFMRTIVHRVAHCKRRRPGLSRAAALFFLLIAYTLSQAPADAQEIPTRINYQGQLTNENGDPIDNASVTMSFSLYDAASGGSKQWPASGTEDHTVNVSEGLFNVILGGIDPLTIASFADSLFLNIEVDDGSGLETLSPRQPLVSAPCAPAWLMASTTASPSTSP